MSCGINPHSLRMNNGKMMSGEWKLPNLTNNLGTIRINPENGDFRKKYYTIIDWSKRSNKKIIK